MNSVRKKQKKNRNLRLALFGLTAALFLLSGCGEDVEPAGEMAAMETSGTQAAGTEQTADQTVTGQTEANKAAAEADVNQGNGAVTFEDDLGRQVTVENPERVATLIGSFTDIWLLAGGDVVAAANDSWESLELDLGEDVVNLGSILEPDVERLIAAEPDLVLASANTEADVAMEDLLTQAGITVAYFAVSDFEEYLHMLDICTDITGRKDLYEQNGLKVQEEIAEVVSRADGSAPTVLFLRASSSSVKAKGSTGNVCGEMLAKLGCVNIADNDKGLLDNLSMEAIIAADPQYIFVTTQGTDTEAALRNVQEKFESDPAWASLTAVKEGNYYILEKRLYNLKPNAKWGQAYRQLADILYPMQEN